MASLIPVTYLATDSRPSRFVLTLQTIYKFVCILFDEHLLCFKFSNLRNKFDSKSKEKILIFNLATTLHQLLIFSLCCAGRSNYNFSHQKEACPFNFVHANHTPLVSSIHSNSKNFSISPIQSISTSGFRFLKYVGVCILDPPFKLKIALIIQSLRFQAPSNIMYYSTSPMLSSMS